MSTAVAKRGPIMAAPKLETVEQSEIRKVYRSRLAVSPTGEFLISADLAPEGTDLVTIRDRRRELLGAMQRGDSRRMGVHITELLAGFPNLNKSGEEAAKTVAAMIRQVEHLPNWAVEKGCIRMAAQNRAFAPSAGELRALCEEVTLPVHEELADLRKIVNAKKITEQPPEVREKMKAKFAQLVAELKHTNAAYKPARRFNPNAMVGKTDAEIQRELKEVRLPQMSPALAAQYAPPPADASPDA